MEMTLREAREKVDILPIRDEKGRKLFHFIVSANSVARKKAMVLIYDKFPNISREQALQGMSEDDIVVIETLFEQGNLFTPN